MRRYFLILAALIFLAQLVQAQAPARTAPSVGGFWYGFGLGAGAVRLSCDICQAETHAGAVAAFRLGGAPSARLRLGLEASGWGEASGDLRRRQGSLTAIAQWRIAPRSRWHATGGAGVTAFRVSEDGLSLSTTVPAFHLGLGYEIPLTPAYALVPALGVSRSLGGSLDLDGQEVVDGAAVTSLHAGLSLLLY